MIYIVYIGFDVNEATLMAYYNGRSRGDSPQPYFRLLCGPKRRSTPS